MLAVLAEAALRAALLAVIVQLGLWMFGIRRAQLLLVAWTVVLAASLAMPALQWATPFPLPVVPGDFAAWSIGSADPQQHLTMSASVSAVEADRLPAIGSCLLAAYLLVSSILILRLLVGVALSLSLLRKAAPIRLNSAINTRICRAVAAPVTVANVILLPPDVLEWPPAMRQAAIAHECAHVARGDFALLVLSQLNRALFWFSPVSWLLHRRLAALAELASDDHAIEVTGDRTGYAEVLLEMGRRSGPLLRGLAMARASTLRHRMERVLSDRVATSPASVLHRSMIVVGAAVASITAASPEFSPGAPPDARARLRSELALQEERAAPAVQTVASLPPPAPSPAQAEDAPQPPSRSAFLLPPAVLAARPAARAVGSATHPGPRPRAVQVRGRATDTQGDVAARMDARATTLLRPLPRLDDDADHPNGGDGAGQVRRAPPAHREARSPPSEPSLFKVIDQQTCNGVYLPGPAGPHEGGWVNMVSAKFFREADGTSWLKFYFGRRDPVDVPVRVTGEEMEFTAVNNTSFKMLPEGTNHLTGTTQNPYGTVDFACGASGAHLFDRKS